MNSSFPFQGRLPAALVLTISILIGGTSVTAATTHHTKHGLSIAPAGLVSAIAKTQAKEAAKNPAYTIAKNGCTSLGVGSKSKALTGCFTQTGPSFTHGKNKINLHLVAWGSKGKLHPVSLHRTTPKANRITYQGKNINEWWRVLPMGYEQGFTINKGPKGNGQVLLQLHSNRTPAIHHNTLAWGNLHYGKLRVIDAKGKTLPSHLTAHGKTVTLAFDASHAQFPVTVDPMVWIQQSMFDPGGAASDYFGSSVALDSSGTTALVGAYNTSGGGAAYVYTMSGGSWTLAHSFADPAAITGDSFGSSVALSSDGATALVGACGTSGGGAAYVYTQGSGWSSVTGPTASFYSPVSSADFGCSVAVASTATGATALVGAWYANVTGEAYIYTQSGGSWATTPTAIFNDPLAAQGGNDRFGISVALDSTGDTALIGAPESNGIEGAAYVYTQSSGSWSGVTTYTASFNDPVATPSYDYFGASVALSGDGTTALVGANQAPYDSATSTTGPGEAFIYTQSSGSWSGVASPTVTFNDPGGASNDYFGSSVALDSTGTLALVGACSSYCSNVAYAYSQSSGSWATTPSTTFTDLNGANTDFGVSVALSGDGTTALVGANYTSGGGAADSFDSFDLSTTLNVPATVAPSTQYNAIYTVTNNGASASADVKVQLPLPTGANYVSVSASQGSCTYSSFTASCDLGAISGGNSASATLTLNPYVATGTAITQTASLVNGSPNLSKTVSTTVEPPAPTVTASPATLYITENTSGTETLTLTGTGALAVSASSSDSTLFPNNSITAGSGCTATTTNCTLTLTPASNATGNATITVTVTDTNGQTGQTQFAVGVLPPAPTVTASPSTLYITENTSGTETLTLTGTGALAVSASSSDSTLFPNNSITAGSGCTSATTNCALTLTPASGATGPATITVSVKDTDGQVTTGTFIADVLPPAPTVTNLSDVTIYVGGTPPTETFSISGTGTLSVTASSSNTTLLPNANITGASSCTAAGSCTLTLTPVSGQTGSATVTVSVKDADGQIGTGTFTFTVNATTGSGGGTGGGGGGAFGLWSLLGLLGLAGLARLACGDKGCCDCD